MALFGVRDWCKELPPGTLLVCKADRSVMALVICIRLEIGNVDPPRFSVTHMTVLTNRSELKESSSSFGFYDAWFKVLT